jgi:hypothetical protein
MNEMSNNSFNLGTGFGFAPTDILRLIDSDGVGVVDRVGGREGMGVGAVDRPR